MLRIIKKNYLLILIFLAALVIRLVGVKPGFSIYHPDEGMSYVTAIHMFFHNLKPNRFDYPAGVPFLHLLIYKMIFLPMVFLKMFFPHPRVFFTALSLGSQFLEEFKGEIFGHAGINALFWSRYISATIGALAVPLVYWIGKKLFNKRVGLFSAFFLAFNYRHVLGSHFGLPDVHNSFFSLLALFASVLLLEKNTKARYLFAGITCGLVFSIKYQTFAYLPFFLVHLIWVWRKRSFQYLFRIDFIQACFLAFLVFLITNPYYFFNLHEVKKMARLVYLRYGMGSFKLSLYPYFYLYHWGVSHWPSLAIMSGMLLMLLTKPQEFFLLFSFVLPFFFVLTYFSDGGSYPHNFVSVVPVLFLFAGFLMDWLYRVFRKTKILPTGALIIILLFYFNFASMKNSLILSYFYAQPWNLTKLNQWLKDKLPAKSQLGLYMIQADQQILKDKEVDAFDWNYSQGAHSLAEFQEKGVDFAILEAYRFEGITYWWRQWPNYMFLKYDQVPFDYIESSFFGLTIKELLNYTVAEIYKPWQAASENNYLIFKIPSKRKEIGRKITSFDFDDTKEIWPVRSTFGFEPIKESWEEGALVIKGESSENTSRLGSPPIKIKPGKLYTVRGWIKNSPQLEEEFQDGFLRIDLYQGKSEAELDKLGLAVALSPRVQVSGEWVKEEASLVAPSQVHYLTISFQRKSPWKAFSSYLDNVEVFESDVLPEEKFKELPYIKPTIPQESIYYNSFL